MTKKPKPVKKTREQLEREFMELKAQMPSSYHFATQKLYTAGEQLMAGGVLLRLEALGGKQLIPPVVIRDGLSRETIEAIYRDLCRSYDLYVPLQANETEEMITVSEAHNRWGDLARIRRGVTTWINVETPEGVWKPVFDGIMLLGYELEPKK